MTILNDDIRPMGAVQVECSVPNCGWFFWLDPLDHRLPDGPFHCGGDGCENCKDACSASQVTAKATDGPPR